MANTDFFTPDEIGDIAEAQAALAKMSIKRKRCSIGLIIALVTELLFIIAFAFGEKEISIPVSNALLITAFVGTVASYVVGGGILTALKVFLGIMKWCWRLCPIIFLDIILVALGGIAGLLALIFVPILYVFINWIKLKREEKYLKEYLGYNNKDYEDAMAQQMAQDAISREG